MLRLFFATDVHGSEACWRKFVAAAKFYGAQVLVLGGDMTGKAIIPLVRGARGVTRVEVMDQVHQLRGDAEVAEMEKMISNKGYYPVRLDEDALAGLQAQPERVETLFTRCVLERIAAWLDYAEAKLAGTGVRIFVCPGNDDDFSVDPLLRDARAVCLAEGRVAAIDEHLSMISTGWANRTPWHTHRERDEADLGTSIAAMADALPEGGAAIFNLHCPPYRSGLDEAPELDDQMRPKYAGHILKPVGSTAVRSAIERWQPVASLHGHIHEGRGIAKIGRTISINPGSSYEQGTLLGARLDFDRQRLVDHTLTSG